MRARFFLAASLKMQDFSVKIRFRVLFVSQIQLLVPRMFQNVSHSFSFVPYMKHIFLFLNVSDCFRTNHFPETKKNGNSEIISFHSFLPKPDREGFICLAFLQLQHSESVLHWHVPVQSEGRQNLRIYPSLLSDYAYTQSS